MWGDAILLPVVAREVLSDCLSEQNLSTCLMFARVIHALAWVKIRSY